jgi:hypothetical protein
METPIPVVNKDITHLRINTLGLIVGVKDNFFGRQASLYQIASQQV